MQRNHAHGLAILNSGAMRILCFWVRVIPQPSGAGAQPEIWQEKRNHARDFKFLENLEIWSHGGPCSIAHLPCTPAGLNRYPRISDAGGHVRKTQSPSPHKVQGNMPFPRGHRALAHNGQGKLRPKAPLQIPTCLMGSQS